MNEIEVRDEAAAEAEPPPVEARASRQKEEKLSESVAEDPP